MDVKDAGALGGRATAASRTPEERSAAMSHAATIRWGTRAEDVRKKRLRARKAGRVAAESRKKNQA